MASHSLLSLQTPLTHRSLLCPRNHFCFPILPLKSLRISRPALVRTSPNAVPGGAAEQEILRAVTDSEDTGLPCVRTFENDSARLTLLAAVDFNQALTAAAADGGRAADEHLRSATPAMVVETVFPGSSDEQSTVSTRLFLPAAKVKEKARKLRRSMNKDILSGTESKNILAMTFRQVVLQQLWSFEVVVISPGVERDMDDLENPREVSASFNVSSSEERVISAFAEAVCVVTLQGTEKNFLDNYFGRSNSGNIFRWFQKQRTFASKDSSVVITQLLEDMIVENAKILVEEFNSVKSRFNPTNRLKSLKYCGWSPSVHSELEKIGGPRFSAWTSEYIPAYRIQIDSDRLKDVKLEGWRKCSENRWEVLLTNSQMVGLTDILDMYYEDPYTLPNKDLSCDMVGNYTNLPSKKRTSFWLKMLSVTLASGVFIVAISAFGQISFPNLKFGKFNSEQKPIPSPEVSSVMNQTLDEFELESYCIKAIQTIKKNLDWAGDIVYEKDVGLWTGNLPEYFRLGFKDKSDYMSITSSTEEKINEEIKISTQDIASYQVVYSLDGKLVGFQPTSRVGVNQWAVNPLANELYGGKKLSPGLLDPGLKVPYPEKGVVVIELLMSVKPDSYFALARPSC